MRKSGRLTDEQVDQVAKLAAVLTLEQIADFLGLSTRTLRRRMEDPRVRTAYQRGKSSAIARVASSLLKLAQDGNVTAMIFYLKTQARWRERDAEMPDMPLGSMSDEQLSEVANGEKPRLRIG